MPAAALQFDPVTKQFNKNLTPAEILAALGLNIVGVSAPRVVALASAGVPSINADVTDVATINALAHDITSVTVTGTPVPEQKLTVRLRDNGVSRSLAWGASIAARGADLPLFTVPNKWLRVALVRNEVELTWDCVATAQE